jgi:hypothetical protein
MNNILLLSCLIGIFGWSSVVTAETPVRSDVLQTTDRIRSEERRQGDVGRQLVTTAIEIERLLKDLASNNLSAKGKSQVHEKMSTGLIDVKEEHVDEATKNLQKARTEINEAYQHLNAADKEVIETIHALDKILKENEEVLKTDLLLEQIQALIKREKFLHRETQRWGIVQLRNEAEAAADKPRVARAQEDALEQLETFKFTLDKAADDAIDGSLRQRFSDASQKYVETKPDLSLQEAIGQIQQDWANKAVVHQLDAIEALEEIKDVLSSDKDTGPSDKELLDELERILAEQIELKEETEEAGKELQDDSDLRTEQQTLQQDLDKATEGETPSESVENASDAMEEAAEQIGQGNQESALAAQETAISELQNAISQLEAEIAAAEDSFAEASDSFADPSDSFADPSDSFAEASDSFPSDGFPSDGFPSDGFPSDGAAPGEGAPGEGSPGEGAPGEGAPGQGPPGPGAPGAPAPGIGPPSSVPGSAPPVPGSFAPAPPGVLPDDPQIDSTGYSSTDPKGNKVARTRMSINTMRRKARLADIQKHVQQLPPEFRKQVAEYYEILSE